MKMKAILLSSSQILTQIVTIVMRIIIKDKSILIIKFIKIHHIVMIKKSLPLIMIETIKQKKKIKFRY